jgi:hypothetical protein
LEEEKVVLPKVVEPDEQMNPLDFLAAAADNALSEQQAVRTQNYHVGWN